jgi:dienelactone hydrolase
MSHFRLLFVILAAFGSVAASGAIAAEPRDEAIEIRSMTPRNPSELMARRSPEAVITGTMRVPPQPHDGAVPAMVIAHGSGGILEGREHEWAGRLNALGIATLVIDSFGPRGIASTGNDQSRLSLAASVADAFSALRVLASDPRIDRHRIGIMGFSKGGQVALYAALEPFRRAVIDDELRFATHIAFYASCSVPYKATRTTSAPMLLLLGADDDYTPSSHCHRYADWLREKGGDVRLIIYDGAGHGFDMPTPPRHLAEAQTARDCRLDLWLDPVAARRWDTGEMLAPAAIGPYLRGCMQRGATFGGSEAARAQAVADLTAHLRRTLLR